MKKRLLLPFLLLSLTQTLKAQTDTIPNAGFEYWIFGGWGSNPAQWIVNNSQIMPANVVPDSDSYSGITAMKMINSGNFRPYAATNFLLSHHPDAFTGFMKNNLVFGDTGTLRIRIFSGGQLVDSGYTEVVGGIIVSGYFSFSVAISQFSVSADSCEIILEGGTMYLSEVTYDDLSLTFSTGTEELPALTARLWPNPCTDQIQVSLLQPVSNCIVELTDITGRLLRSETHPGAADFRVETASLAAGSYLLTVRTDSAPKSLRFIKH